MSGCIPLTVQVVDNTSPDLHHHHLLEHMQGQQAMHLPLASAMPGSGCPRNRIAILDPTQIDALVWRHAGRVSPASPADARQAQRR